MYSFYLDGKKLTSTPDGWEDFTSQISRSIESRRITIQYPTNLVFYGDAFTILWDAINSYGYDKTFEFRAEKVASNGFISSQVYGVVFMIDVVFNVVERTATTQVKENGFMAKLFGNVNNPIALPSLETKNGEVLSLLGQTIADESTSSRVSVEMDVPALGGLTIAHNGKRKGVDVFKALQEMVQHMSDNKVTLKSSFFDRMLIDGHAYAPDYESPLCLIRGRELRLGTDRTDSFDFSIVTSWEKLFMVVANIFNVYYYPNTDAQPPELIIGDENEFFSTSSPTARIESPENMQLSYFQELFYSSVKIGAGATSYKEGNTATNLPDVQFQTFKTAEYYLSGESNIGGKKDLSVTGYIYDSNIIRDVLINDNDAYDDQIFLLQYFPNSFLQNTTIFAGVSGDRAQSFQLFKTDDGLGGLDLFNGGLVSSEIIKNHSFYGQIKQSATDIETDNRVSYSSANNDIISNLALKNQYNLPVIDELKYSTLQYDYSEGRYNPLEGEYTAQFGGMYSFDINVIIEANVLSNYAPLISADGQKHYSQDWLSVEIHLEILSGEDVVLDAVLSKKLITARGLYTTNALYTTHMNANEKCRVKAYSYTGGAGLFLATQKPYLDYNLEWDILTESSSFEVSSTPNLSFRYTETQQTNEYKAVKVVLNHYLNESQLKNVLANPERPIKLLNFVEFGAEKDCWISEMKINRETGNIDATLITNIAKAEQ